MRKVNYPLLLGTMIVLTLLVMSFFPQFFTDKDPLFETSAKYIEVKEGGEWVEKFGYNPMPPNRDNIMGTDDAGRDVYTRLIYGTKNTLKLVFLIALFRLCVAFPLGVAAGMGIKPISAFIRVFNTFFTAIPILIFSYIILNIAYFKYLQMDVAITAFAVVLTALGWAKLAGMIEDSTRQVMDEDFIEGEIAIGKTKLQIAFQNVLPHIIPDAISLFFKEMGMAMFLIAQLAVFGVFVGVARRVNALAFKADYEMILEPEWGGTLSRIALNLRKFDAVYWMTVYPILLFSLAIMGLNLFGEGLKMEFQKRNSRVISRIRKTYYLISPKMFISQMKDFKRYYKSLIAKVALVIMLIVYVFYPWHPSAYTFDRTSALEHLETLSSADFYGREAGTEGGHLAGEYIKNTLLSYGYAVEEMPLKFVDDTGEHPRPLDLSPITIEDGQIMLTDKNGDVKTYKLYEDFAILSIGRSVFMEEATERLVFSGFGASLTNTSDLTESESIIPLNMDYPNLHEYYARYTNQFRISRDKSLPYDAEIIMSGRGYGAATIAQVFNATSIIPYKRLYEDLSSGDYDIIIDLSYPKLAKYDGRNIIATMLGKDKTTDSPGEIVMIGAAYDGTYSGETGKPFVMNATPASIALEVARVLSGLEHHFDKTIQFVFWDNQAEFSRRSKLSGAGSFHLTAQRDIKMAMDEGFYYIDISYPGYKETEKLYITTLPAQRADGKNYLIGLDMEKRLKQMKIDYRRFHYDYGATPALDYLRLNASTSIGVGNANIGGINTQFDSLENLDVDRFEQMGQLIVDTLTMTPHLITESDLRR